MGKIKIIFFDIDGTLLRLRAKELSEKTVEALNRLKANGIRQLGEPRSAFPISVGLNLIHS